MSLKHCVETVERLVAEGRGESRAVFQLGYNLGRLSELSGLGREPFWDRWKGPVSDWDLDRLNELAQDLRKKFNSQPLIEESPDHDSPGV